MIEIKEKKRDSILLKIKLLIISFLIILLISVFLIVTMFSNGNKAIVTRKNSIYEELEKLLEE